MHFSETDLLILSLTSIFQYDKYLNSVTSLVLFSQNQMLHYVVLSSLFLYCSIAMELWSPTLPDTLTFFMPTLTQHFLITHCVNMIHIPLQYLPFHKRVANKDRSAPLTFSIGLDSPGLSFTAHIIIYIKLSSLGYITNPHLTLTPSLKLSLSSLLMHTGPLMSP